MRRKITFFMYMILLTLLGLSFIPEDDQDDIIKSGAQLEKLAGSFSFTEVPASDAKGNVYFTDQPNNRILVWTTGGELLAFMLPCGRSNGLFFDRMKMTVNGADK